MRIRQLVFIVVLLPLLGATPALAQGEHSRRAASELLILRGDARALTATPAPSKLHQKGLRDRLRGGLSSIAILMRLADQELSQPRAHLQPVIAKLVTALQESDFERFEAGASQLIKRYPLTPTGILPASPTPARLKRAKEIHESTCAGCHDDPDMEVERPAYDFFKQVKRMSPLEFTARMIIGVRGDRVTGISNPLANEEIAALIAYYNSGPG